VSILLRKSIVVNSASDIDQLYKNNIIKSNNKIYMVSDTVMEFVELASSDILTEKIKTDEHDIITTDLKSLGNVISCVTLGNISNESYKNNTLTHVLKNSLNKNSDISIFLCISPGINTYKSSCETLKWGARIRECQVDISTNEDKNIDLCTL